MGHTKWLCIGLAALLPTLVACGDDGGDDGNNTPDAAVVDIDADTSVAPVVETKTFQLIADPYTELAGSSITLTRDPANGEVFIDSITATGLPEGEVVTVWWAAFNQVSECTSPNTSLGALCGVPDMTANPPVAGALLYGGPHPDGAVTVDATGEATFPKLTLGVIAADAPADPFKNVGPGNGLNDALASEIHIILQKHGVALTGDELLSQETEFNGGCKTGQTGAPDPDANPPVPSRCALIHVAAFQPAE